MQEQVITKFMELGVVGIILLGALYLFVKFYIEDRNQSKTDKDQVRIDMEYYRTESKEQRTMFINTMDKFHGQMDKFGDALNSNNNQIQLLNENFKDMESKVDNITQEISTMKGSK